MWFWLGNQSQTSIALVLWTIARLSFQTTWLCPSVTSTLSQDYCTFPVNVRGAYNCSLVAALLGNLICSGCLSWASSLMHPPNPLSFVLIWQSRCLFDLEYHWVYGWYPFIFGRLMAYLSLRFLQRFYVAKLYLELKSVEWFFISDFDFTLSGFTLEPYFSVMELLRLIIFFCLKVYPGWRVFSKLLRKRKVVLLYRSSHRQKGPKY